MRPRPIDMSNRMPVVQSQNELWVDPEDQQLKHRRDISESRLDDEDDGVISPDAHLYTAHTLVLCLKEPVFLPHPFS